MQVKFLFLMAVFSICIFCYGEEDGAASEQNRKNAAINYEKNLKKYKGNSDFLVLPGLVADRKEQKVVIDAEVTELVRGEPSEMYIIYDKSSHGYEALVYSFAAPGNVMKALKFLGMEPGEAVDGGKMLLWPKGERVFVNFIIDTNKMEEIPLKNFVVLSATKKNPDKRLPQVFTGSIMTPDLDDPSKMVLMADNMDPYGIATSYTEPGSIMNPPDNVSKGRAYGSVTSGSLLPPKGSPLKVVLRPEYTDGKKRMQFYNLLITTNGVGNLSYHLQKKDADDTNIMTLDRFLKAMVDSVENGHDPFVTVSFDKTLDIGTIKKIASFLQEIESVNGIRVDVPSPGEPFYRAFLPNEDFRDRKKRYSQPCELWLSETNGVVAAKIIKPTATYSENHIEPHITTKEYPINSLIEYRETIDRLSDPEVKVVLFFVPENMEYKKVYRYIKPIMDDYPTIYVFGNKE